MCDYFIHFILAGKIYEMFHGHNSTERIHQYSTNGFRAVSHPTFPYSDTSLYLHGEKPPKTDGGGTPACWRRRQANRQAILAIFGTAWRKDCSHSFVIASRHQRGVVFCGLMPYQQLKQLPSSQNFFVWHLFVATIGKLKLAKAATLNFYPP